MKNQKNRHKFISSFILLQALLFSGLAQAQQAEIRGSETTTGTATENNTVYRSKYFKNALSNQACTSALGVFTKTKANQTNYSQLDRLIEAFSVECGVSQEDSQNDIDFKAVGFKFENEKLFILWDGQFISINEKADATLEHTMPPGFNNVITIKSTDVNPKKENKLLTRITRKLDDVKNHLQMIKDQGQTRLILAGYAHHDRNTYTPEKISELNEKAWGIGVERVFINHKGNRESVFAMIFLDSHGDPEPTIGYNWQAGFSLTRSIKAYLGASAGLTMRSDMLIKDKYPFPVPYVFPTWGLSIGKFDIQGVIIPNMGGGVNNGNVFFIFASVPIEK